MTVIVDPKQMTITTEGNLASQQRMPGTEPKCQIIVARDKYGNINVTVSYMRGIPGNKPRRDWLGRAFPTNHIYENRGKLRIFLGNLELDRYFNSVADAVSELTSDI